MKSSTKILVLYVVFAGISILVNIGFQILTYWLYKGIYSIEISILSGTLAGLPLRYILEKKYIFSYKSKNLKHDGKLFFLYALMAIVTTLIFWFTEYAFHIIFATNSMRYLGAIIGLSIGFYVKYRLDKKFVFVSKNREF